MTNYSLMAVVRSHHPLSNFGAPVVFFEWVMLYIL